ncbi:septation protein SepH [Nocardia sp. CNY236]|uniref:septation protein SepH n=1 Tax=Nocardia sp. CNY236 TaxID=1169152 RepID=UPI0004249C8F|nr:septation protein SepH [Nocardia sp. CNY236]
MRELRVIGVTPDSTHIVCIDTESGQKFRLPADDKLRAAARGDLARFGQIEIEMEATMRPRDIQARIRAGASVEQVTEESGMPPGRVERFAYPVLLERARAAELAQKAHPVRPDGPATESLIDVVTAAFTARGHNIDGASWDAWKDEKGFWVAQLQWRNGRSEISAHWRFQPDAHGGSVSPLDDPSADLIDPDFGRALRGLATIVAAETEPAATKAEPAGESRPTPTAPPARTAAARPGQSTLDEYYEQRAVAAGGNAAVRSSNTGATGAAPSAVGKTSASTTAAETSADPAVDGPSTESDTTTPPASEESTKPAAKAPTAKPSRSKRGKAPMPSWEDVLLGVRSSGH